MICNICNNNNFEYDNQISAKCKTCGILYNLNARPLNYSNGGGQNIPDTKKSELRIQNALQRFKIIKRYMDNHDVFVDIGCGSGEMLEASKQYFKFHLGYDENKILIAYTQNKGLNTYNKCFERKDIKIKSSGIVVSVSHVLEHVEKPLDMLKNIIGELRDNDILYIEVPLYTGYSFKTKKYNWSLWYDEHLALYSIKTLQMLARQLNLCILEYGYRNFYSDNFNKKLALKLFIRNPIKFLQRHIQRKSYQLLLDNQLRDYGFIVCKIQKGKND